MGLRGTVAVAVIGVLALFCGVVGNPGDLGGDPKFKPVDYSFYCPPETVDECGDYCYFANCEVCRQCCDCQEIVISCDCFHFEAVTDDDGKVIGSRKVCDRCTKICDCDPLTRSTGNSTEAGWECTSRCRHCAPCLSWQWYVRPKGWTGVQNLPSDWDIDPDAIYEYSNKKECDLLSMEFPVSKQFLNECGPRLPNTESLLPLGEKLPDYNCRDNEGAEITQPEVSVPLGDNLRVIQVFTTGGWSQGYDISHIGFGMTGVDRISAAGLKVEVWEYVDELFLESEEGDNRDVSKLVGTLRTPSPFKHGFNQWPAGFHLDPGKTYYLKVEQGSHPSRAPQPDIDRASGVNVEYGQQGGSLPVVGQGSWDFEQSAYVHEHVVSEWFPTPWPDDGGVAYPDPAVPAVGGFAPTRFWQESVEYTQEDCEEGGYTERQCKRDKWVPYPGPVRMEFWGRATGMPGDLVATRTPSEGRFRWDSQLLLVMRDSGDGDRSVGRSTEEGRGPAGVGHAGPGLGGEEVTHMMPGDTGGFGSGDNSGDFGSPAGFEVTLGTTVDATPQVGLPAVTVPAPNPTTVRYPEGTPLTPDQPPYPGAELAHGLQPVEGDPYGMELLEVMKVDDFRFQLKFIKQRHEKVAEGEWAWGCNSEDYLNPYVRFYRFEVWEPGKMKVELSSGRFNSNLYLREGLARSGPFVGSDSGTGDLEIEAELEEGEYTVAVEILGPREVELGGVPPDVVGGLSLVVSAVTEGVDEEDVAFATSAVAVEDHYSRFYRFAITEDSVVTATLDSGGIGSHLFLRRGLARSGEPLEDTGYGYRSFSGELEAGTYTFEVVADIAEDVGEFSLTVSGLGYGTAVGADEDVGPCEEDLTFSGYMYRAFPYDGWYSALETLSVTPWKDWEYEMDDLRYPFRPLRDAPPEVRVEWLDPEDEDYDPADYEVAMVTVELEDWQKTYGGRGGETGHEAGWENTGGVFVFQLAYSDVRSREPLQWTDGLFHFAGYRELPGHSPMDWSLTRDGPANLSVDGITRTEHDGATPMPALKYNAARPGAPRITRLEQYGVNGDVGVFVSPGSGRYEYRLWPYYGGRAEDFDDSRFLAEGERDDVDYEWKGVEVEGGKFKVRVPFTKTVWAFETRVVAEVTGVDDEGVSHTFWARSPGSNVEQIAVWGDLDGFIPTPDPDG